MPKKNPFLEPQNYSDEEELIVEEDTCSISFPVNYKIVDESAVSLKNDYILSLCADESFGKIAAGLSNNSVHIFDLSTRSLSSSSTIELIPNSTVCRVKFIDKSANNLLVGATYGDVLLCDVRTGKIEHSFENTSDGKKKPITSFDINANDRIICSGTEKVKDDVYLQFFDVRKKEIMGGYWESHQDDVTDVKFHPTNPNLLCTGSVDGLINIFDISESSEEDALTSTINTESSVHKLNWHKNIYEKDILYCITHMNELKTYECEEGDILAEFDRIQVAEAIKRKSAAEDCNLVSSHSLADGGVFLLAASNYNKGNVVWSVQMKGKELLPYGNFDGNKQIIRASVHDPKTNMLVTGGESGIVTLWSSSESDQPKSSSNKLKAKSKAGKKHGKDPY